MVRSARRTLQNALDLLEDATRRALATPGLEAEAIDVVRTVCTTGIATPRWTRVSPSGAACVTM